MATPQNEEKIRAIKTYLYRSVQEFLENKRQEDRKVIATDAVNFTFSTLEEVYEEKNMAAQYYNKLKVINDLVAKFAPFSFTSSRGVLDFPGLKLKEVEAEDAIRIAAYSYLLGAIDETVKDAFGNRLEPILLEALSLYLLGLKSGRFTFEFTQGLDGEKTEELERARKTFKKIFNAPEFQELKDLVLYLYKLKRFFEVLKTRLESTEIRQGYRSFLDAKKNSKKIEKKAIADVFFPTSQIYTTFFISAFEGEDYLQPRHTEEIEKYLEIITGKKSARFAEKFMALKKLFPAYLEAVLSDIEEDIVKKSKSSKRDKKLVSALDEKYLKEVFSGVREKVKEVVELYTDFILAISISADNLREMNRYGNPVFVNYLPPVIFNWVLKDKDFNPDDYEPEIEVSVEIEKIDPVELDLKVIEVLGNAEKPNIKFFTEVIASLANRYLREGEGMDSRVVAAIETYVGKYADEIKRTATQSDRILLSLLSKEIAEDILREEDYLEYFKTLTFGGIGKVYHENSLNLSLRMISSEDFVYSGHLKGKEVLYQLFRITENPETKKFLEAFSNNLGRLDTFLKENEGIAEDLARALSSYTVRWLWSSPEEAIDLRDFEEKVQAVLKVMEEVKKGGYMQLGKIFDRVWRTVELSIFYSPEIPPEFLERYSTISKQEVYRWRELKQFKYRLEGDEFWFPELPDIDSRVFEEYETLSLVNRPQAFISESYNFEESIKVGKETWLSGVDTYEEIISYLERNPMDFWFRVVLKELSVLETAVEDVRKTMREEYGGM